MPSNDSSTTKHFEPDDAAAWHRKATSERDELAIATSMLLGAEFEFGPAREYGVERQYRKCRHQHDSRWHSCHAMAAWMYLLHRGFGISSDEPWRPVELFGSSK